MKRSYILFLTLALTACGGDKKDENSSKQESYHYSLDHNGCKTEKTLSSKQEYCSTLQDETANDGCALEEREELYKRDCGNDFRTTNPIRPEPIHTPQPQPEPQQEPQPQPQPQPATPGEKVTADLAAAGIQVKVNYDHQFPMPGERPFQERLADFWVRLEQVEALPIARQANLNHIFIAEYGSLHLPGKYITLSVDMSLEQLRVFFTGFDRLVALRAETGVSAEPYVIEYRAGRPDGSAELLAEVAFLERASRSLKGVVRELGFENTTIYSLFDRKLSLSYEKHEQDFQDIAKVLQAAQPFFAFADPIGLDIRSTSFVFNSSTDKDAIAFVAVTQSLYREKDSLAAIVRAGFLKEIDTIVGSEETSFYPQLKQLTVANAGVGLSQLHNVLVALAEQMKFSKASGIEFDYGFSSRGLGSDFLVASQHLSGVLPAIAAKKDLVDKIAFTDKSSFQYKLLWVGSKDSASELAAVVRGIH